MKRTYFNCHLMIVNLIAAMAIMAFCGASSAQAEADAKAIASKPLELIKVSDDGTHFVGAESGKTFKVWGVNYDHDATKESRLLEDYWDLEWESVVQDFGEIRDLGANVVRIHLQVAKFLTSPTTANQDNLDRLGKLLKVAQSDGLRLDITGLGCYNKGDVPKWYDDLSESDRWAAQCVFWKAVANVCKDSGGVVFCYDLMNEPVLAGEVGKPVANWLAGEFGNKSFVQYISRDLKGRTRIETARAWVKQLTDAIREVDKVHMITVGIIPWALTFKGAKPIFYDSSVDGPLDFVAVHFYPKAGEVDQALEAMKVYAVPGKPIVVEEMFPLACSTDDLDRFIHESKSYCDGYISFYWGATIEDLEKKKGDMGSAIMAAWLKHFKQLSSELP